MSYDPLPSEEELQAMAKRAMIRSMAMRFLARALRQPLPYKTFLMSSTILTARPL